MTGIPNQDDPYVLVEFNGTRMAILKENWSEAKQMEAYMQDAARRAGISELEIMCKFTLRIVTDDQGVELTQTEKDLVAGLKHFGVSEENLVGTMLALDSKDSQEELISFLIDRPSATEQEIMKEVFRIRKTIRDTYTEPPVR